MRVVLLTGKGGVGKTTVAAGTAVLAARRGAKTLVLSTDAAHSLGDALGVGLGPQPVAVEGVDGLEALQVDAQRDFERSWRQVADYLSELMQRSGMDAVAAEELTVLPGAEEVLALLALREQVQRGRYDLIVVDCAPTAETLRLLALPEALTWYMRKVFPIERRVARSLRPLLTRRAGMPLPDDKVFDAVDRLHGQLLDVRGVLADPARTSVRLVLTPEAVVVAEARRTLTSLSLHGYRVDAVVANRIFPAGGDDWRQRWSAAQAGQLSAVTESFAPLPVLRAGYSAAEPVGPDALGALAEEVYGTLDPAELPIGADPVRVERTTDGYALTIALPFASREQVSLTRRGDEITVGAAGARRVIALPSALRRCTLAGAVLRDGGLRISFLPDPAVWMQP